MDKFGDIVVVVTFLPTICMAWVSLWFAQALNFQLPILPIFMIGCVVSSCMVLYTTRHVFAILTEWVD